MSRVFTPEWRAKLSASHRLKGKTFEEVYGAEEAKSRKAACGSATKGKTYEEIYGAARAEELRNNRRGKNNSSWNGGVTPLEARIRNTDLYRRWRTQVFERDNYTCQACSKRGCHLEAHHLKRFIQIVKELLLQYPQFSPIEDKETLVRLTFTYAPLWDITNGQTLCLKCHAKTKGNYRPLTSQE